MVLKELLPACATSGSKSSSLYVWEFILAPWGTKLRFVREFANTHAQTIRGRGFRTLSKYVILFGMSVLTSKQQVYSRFNDYLTFTLWKTSHPWRESGLPSQDRVLSCLHLRIAYYVWTRWDGVRYLMKDMPSLATTNFRIFLWLTETFFALNAGELS